MTLEERMTLAERNAAIFREHLEAAGNLLLRTVEATNKNTLAIDQLTSDVSLLANKIDKFVDAVFNRPNGSHKQDPAN
jgi:hypothetical protein